MCFVCRTGLFLSLLPVIRHASRNGAGDVVTILGEDAYVVAVNESYFDEQGGHCCIPKHAETWMGLNAAVDVTEIILGDSPKHLVLARCRQRAFRLRLLVSAPLPLGVDVDGHEYIRLPRARAIDDTGIASYQIHCYGVLMVIGIAFSLHTLCDAYFAYPANTPLLHTYTLQTGQFQPCPPSKPQILNSSIH